MGYRGGLLESLGDGEESLIEAGRRTTNRVGSEMLRLVKHHTPVAKPPPGAAAEWLASRGRMPGTLRESWQLSQIVYASHVHHHGIDVYSEDPIVRHVEYPTMPHIIVPKRSRGPNAMLRFWTATGSVVFAYLVHHPGTQGTYMLATAMAEIEGLWTQIGEEEFALWAAGQ